MSGGKDDDYVDTGPIMAWVGFWIFVALGLAIAVAYYIGHS